jgi:hypothetical protein
LPALPIEKSVRKTQRLPLRMEERKPSALLKSWSMTLLAQRFIALTQMNLLRRSRQVALKVNYLEVV